MARTKRLPISDADYDPNFGLTCKYPITIHQESVSVGPVNFELPMLCYRQQTRRQYAVHLPYALRDPLGLPGVYQNKETNQELTEALGPSFPRRFRHAMVLCFERPLTQLMGATMFRQMCMWFPKGEHDVVNWGVAWKDRPLLLQLKLDGMAKMYPLLRAFALTNEPQPIQALRNLVGRALWLELCTFSTSRLWCLSGGVWDLEPARQVRHLAVLSQWPSTLLRSMRASVQPIAEQEYVMHLAKQKPWPWKNTEQYVRACHLWAYVDIYGGGANPEWSLRRVAEEHRRTMEAANDRHEAQRIAAGEAYAKPFEVPTYVPRSHTLGNTTATLLLTRDEYHEQGKAEHHCVGAYGRQAAEGMVFTYSLTRKGKVVSTAMLDKQGTLKQQYGKRNKLVTDAEALALVIELTLAFDVALIQSCVVREDVDAVEF